ncbi:MAG: hypothetical protein MZV70_52810 [Desulfobacterales bacterium]|nr:hypothetical protein [Desulfobacterales bacterium]
MVSVPVLSEQMTVAQPSVSTDGQLADRGRGAGPCAGRPGPGRWSRRPAGLRDGGHGQADRGQEHRR